MDEKPALIVLGSRNDPHVDRVVAALERREKLSVHLLDCIDGTEFAVEFGQCGKVEFTIAGVAIPPNFSLWNRLKFIPGTILDIKSDRRSKNFAKYEWVALTRLLCGMCRGALFNDVEIRNCHVKPLQQLLAEQAGMRSPRTLLSNSKPHLLDFHGRNEDGIIVKSIAETRVEPEDGDGQMEPYTLMTMRVDEKDLCNISGDELGYCPHLFQSEIRKRHELRVVYIDGALFAYRVDSQKSRITEVDWRNGHEWVEFSEHDLDDSTIVKIHEFMKRVGLFSGSLDLIVDLEGDIWFLECNRDGQWAWLDDLSGGKIALAFASAFERRVLNQHVK